MGRLYLHTSAMLGGSERSFLDHLKRISLQERKSCLVVLPSEGELKQEILRIDSTIDVRVLPFPKSFESLTRKRPFKAILNFPFYVVGLISMLITLKTWMRTKNISLIYSNGIKCHIYSLLLKNTKTNLIWHMQDYFPAFAFVKWYLRLFRRGPDTVISNSESVEREVKNVIPESWKSKTQFCVVHNAVDINQYRANSSTALPHALRISMVGLLTPWKGQHVFIEALRILEEQNLTVNYEAWIVGDELYKTEGESGYRQQLVDKVRDYGLEHRVFFSGFVIDMPELYSKTDIVTHCSIKPEPFGRVIVEAMASGCVVVATRGGGVVEIVRDDVDGILVPMGDAQALAEQLKRLMLDPQLRKRISVQARKSAAERFSADVFHKKIEESLEQVS